MLVRFRPREAPAWFPVSVNVEGDPTGDELLDAMVSARLLGEDERKSVRISRNSTHLAGRHPLTQLGLRSGDLLTVAATPQQARAEATTRSPWQLVVASGPGAGQRFSVGASGITVGRDPSSDICLGDEGMSGRHFAIGYNETGPSVADLGSRNGTFHAGHRVGETPVQVHPDLPIEAGTSLFRLEPSRHGVNTARVHWRGGHVEVNRTPRLALTPAPDELAVQAPPEPRPSRRVPWIAASVPMLMAPVMVLSGGSKSFLLLALLSPLMMLGAWFEDRRHGGKDHAEQVARFRADLAKNALSLREAVLQDCAAQWASAPDPAELVARTAPTIRLWERSLGDQDFGVLRLGWSERASGVRWAMTETGDRALRQEAADLLDPILSTSNLPVTVNLRVIGNLGIVGSPQGRDLGRWSLLQLATLHSPRDLAIAAVVPDPASWDWLSRLPHAYSGSDGPSVVSQEAVPTLLGALCSEIRSRQESAQQRMGGGIRAQQAVVVMVDDRVEIPRSQITELLEDGPAVGVHVLWFTDSPGAVPAQCRAIVTVHPRGLDVTWADTGVRLSGVAPDQISPADVDEAGWRLTGLRDAASRDQGAGIPSRVTLAENLDLPDPTAADIVERWQRTTGIAAPLGRDHRGAFTLDLREDGPHALLGGTTGAGKSELLQTLVASLAATNPPRDLTFLLVDYKGGAAFKDCVDLPHTVGYVTDLDGHLVLRVLTSLHAELGRRERQLASVGAKDLLDMRAKAPELTPPSLLLIVDEFAALASELPEFVDGMVNLAQRGRSLGIHLLLATQRPAGAINDNIRANTNLRMSLRMNDQADSEDVIGSPLAARLPRSLPGRAFVRTGSTELTEIQVAYSGGHSFGQLRREHAAITINYAGKPSTTVIRKVEAATTDETDLMRLVGVIRDAFAGTGDEPPRRPWLPALENHVACHDLPDQQGLRVALGVVDEPQRQAQVPYVLDLSAGGVLVAGGGGTGKTTVLNTTMTRLAEQNSPADLHLYALDFGSRGLASLDSLPHVGDVVFAEETDRVIRLFSRVQSEILRRRNLMGDHGVNTFAGLREREPGVRAMVIALDAYGSFAQAFERVDYGIWLERFPTLVNEGRAVGIHWIVSAERRLAMSMAVQSAFPQRLVLRFPEVDEYDGFGLDRAKVAGAHLPPGRGFTADSDEVQVATYGTDGSLTEQAQAIGALGSALAARWPNQSAPAIRLLPRWTPVSDLSTTVDIARVPFGLCDLDFTEAVLDLGAGSFLTVGSRRSGKSTTLATMATALDSLGTELILFAPRHTTLTTLTFWRRVGTSVDACGELLEELLLTLDQRDETSPWLVLVVDDADEFVDHYVDERLSELIKSGAQRRIRVIAAADKRSAHRTYGGALQRLRGERRGLVLQPDPLADGDLFEATLDRRIAGGPPGRAVVVENGEGTLVQIATSELF